jgi:hypothetical protein
VTWLSLEFEVLRIFNLATTVKYCVVVAAPIVSVPAPSLRNYHVATKCKLNRTRADRSLFSIDFHDVALQGWWFVFWRHNLRFVDR